MSPLFLSLQVTNAYRLHVSFAMFSLFDIAMHVRGVYTGSTNLLGDVRKSKNEEEEIEN